MIDPLLSKSIGLNSGVEAVNEVLVITILAAAELVVLVLKERCSSQAKQLA